MHPGAISLTYRSRVIRGVRARVDARMKLGLIAVLLSALPAAASDFNARYPPGSIHDAAAAQAALKDADAEMARISQDAKARDAECYRRLLVNACRDDVRREKELAEREVKRVRLEANDLRRKLDAEQVAKRRAEEAAARAAEDAERARKAAASRAEYEAREAEVKRRQEEAKANGTASKGAQSAPAPSKDRLTAAERAENARQYEEKQAQAAKRAQEVEARQKENEQRRAEKRKQSEQREAEREAIRKKAAEASK
jgi:colicin import membrane protein